ncbi:hypothetical protein SAMN02745945_00770 [Peptoclostridium litorale DSM 5388]|uniref:Twitching motility protein PilT n=1 Tax=Peptoclostridium litorale DSM 5388 TaxID=1121324 RepID=A0A069RAJ9_PEPLI|nr:hypothetical protein [Peptoclostridium litorale]KDR94089.1 hypothetical protein CLIT_23c03610 [Peptoclostridium litorale DSM 5388]SIN80715.1 hypothetical protein SAMN02745945_00770 [Peptoclostridium litorale DSM 5388]
MVKLLLGKAGSGKTKKMIRMANKDILNSKGEIVFIDSDNRHMHELHRNIRLIPSNEFNLDNIDSFYGFLCGMVGENYDIEKIYVDGIKDIIPDCSSNFKPCFEKLKSFSSKFGIKLLISASSDLESELSDFEKYTIMESDSFLEQEKMLV